MKNRALFRSVPLEAEWKVGILQEQRNCRVHFQCSALLHCGFLRATGNEKEPCCLHPLRKEAQRDTGSWKRLWLAGTTSRR